MTPVCSPRSRPCDPGPTIEVAHEALLTRWPRLAEWITEAREDLLLHQRLSDAADEWDQRHHDEAYLLTGGRLVSSNRGPPLRISHLLEWSPSTSI